MYTIIKRRPKGERLGYHVTLEIVKLSEDKVRTIFNIAVKIDLPIHDDKRRKTFIKLLVKNTRLLYAQSAMLAAQMSPELSLTMEDKDGVQEIDIFAEDKSTIDSGD